MSTHGTECHDVCIAYRPPSLLRLNPVYAKVESSTRLGGFGALKKTTDAPYTIKVNYRVRTSRGTTHGWLAPMPKQRPCKLQNARAISAGSGRLGGGSRGGVELSNVLLEHARLRIAEQGTRQARGRLRRLALRGVEGGGVAVTLLDGTDSVPDARAQVAHLQA